MFKRMASGALVATLLALTLGLAGCGGGVEVGVTIPVVPPAPEFDVSALINGQSLSGVDVFPGESQTISVLAGDAFELDASGPVYWDFSAGGSADIPAATGSTIVYAGATLRETVASSSQLVLAVDSTAPAGSTIPVTIYATSVNDPSQYATIHLLVQN